jgi:hypothetical protein
MNLLVAWNTSRGTEDFMASTRVAFGLLVCLVCMGCFSHENSEIASSYDTGSLSKMSAPTEARAQESLFKEDQAVLSNEDMAKILAAKVVVPEQAKLAVVRFGQLPYWWGWSEDFVRVNEKIDSEFLGALKSAKGVREVAYLPSLVTPKEMTLPHLRQAAARFQADLLLVYRTSSQNYQRSKIFTEDETRAYCTVEAVLLDTRTGLIPFSTVVTEQFSAKKNRQDYDFQETIAKASQQAIAKAWLHLAEDVKGHLGKL